MSRRRLPLALVLFLALVLVLAARMHAQAPDADPVYAVTYVEVLPAARGSMAGALRQYREGSRKESGFVRIDGYEQDGWRAHFALVEAWRDQQAFDLHARAAHAMRFRGVLDGIRQSGYDQRLYRALSVGSPAAGARPGGAIHVIAHVDAAPRPQVDAPGLLRGLAEASRKEAGNLRFDVLQQVGRPNHFTVLETWRSRAALDAHAAADHTRKYREDLTPISGSPIDQRVFNAVE